MVWAFPWSATWCDDTMVGCMSGAVRRMDDTAPSSVSSCPASANRFSASTAPAAPRAGRPYGRLVKPDFTPPNPKAYAMVLLSLRYGLRCSEATGLSLGHVDLKTQQIRVERL